jgi:hypothetical protein
VVSAAPGFRCVDKNILGGNRVIDAGRSIRPPAAPPNELCNVRRSGLLRFSGPFAWSWDSDALSRNPTGEERAGALISTPHRRPQERILPHLLASAPLLDRGLEDWPYVCLRKWVPCSRLAARLPVQERRFHGVPHARVNKKLHQLQ